jgi:acetyltransferase-like isoleucine patch superfamily enzyme
MNNKIFRTFLYIFNSAKKEKPIVSFFMIFRLLFELINGHFSAYVNGFSNSFLGPNSRVIGTKYITVGQKASIKKSAWIEAIDSYKKQIFNPYIKIGNNFFASERLHISAINKIEIGNDCLFGSGVYIGDHNHGVYKGNEQSAPFEPPIERLLASFGPVIIGSNVWFGDNVVVIGPVVIGDGAVIGANSVVTKNVPANVIALGSPLRIIKEYNNDTGFWQRNNNL